MKALRQSVRDYLQLRRGLGFKLNVAEARLGQFLEFLKAKKSSRITTKLALEFATQNPQWSLPTQASRLVAVRGFARYHRIHDPATEVPPRGLLSSAYRPAAPYLYSPTEIQRLLAGASLPRLAALSGAALAPVPSLDLLLYLWATGGERHAHRRGAQPSG